MLFSNNNAYLQRLVKCAILKFYKKLRFIIICIYFKGQIQFGKYKNFGGLSLFFFSANLCKKLQIFCPRDTKKKKKLFQRPRSRPNTLVYKLRTLQIHIVVILFHFSSETHMGRTNMFLGFRTCTIYIVTASAAVLQ